MRNSTIYKLAGPVTFRRASSKWFGRRGSNLQNVEKEMRAIYIPDGFDKHIAAKCKYFLESGDISVFTEAELETLRIMLQCDQAGAEALIVAYDCEPLDYRKLFLNNVKVHVYVALKLFLQQWKQKSIEHKLTMDDGDWDILNLTPIEKLKLNPKWRDADLLIKASDNWSTTERFYYLAKQTVHCVDGETEILTRNGWKRVSMFRQPEDIAIYCDNNSIKFETPSSWNVFPYQGDMIRFVGEEVDQLVTPNHKVVYVSNGKRHVQEADYCFNLNRLNIPTSGFKCDGIVNLPTWKIKLLAAIQADGQIIENNCVRFKFAKDRKIDRLLEIVKDGNLSHRWHDWIGRTSANNPVSSIVIEHQEDLIQLLGEQKLWGSWLLDFSIDNLSTLIDELKYWDGSFAEGRLHKREEYFTKHDINAEWIKTICHLVDKQGTIAKRDGQNKIGINSRSCSIVKEKARVNYNGFVYCPTVSSGMFLIRRNGKISVTHNSANYDIQAAMFIMNILEKSGGKIVIDKDQGDYFLSVYRGLFPEIPDRNRRVRQQVDKTGIIYNFHGHPYQITSYNISESDYKKLYAWGPQSTVGEITRIAFCGLQEYIEAQKLRWDILADTHDSYLVQCPLMDIAHCSSKMQEYMNQRLTSPIDGTEFNMKSEVNIGFNWGPFYPNQPDKNPLGLREVKWLKN